MVSASEARTALVDAFAAALEAVDPEQATERALEEAGIVGPVVVAALGKAAPGMARGADRALGDRVIEAVVVTDHPEPLPEGYRLIVAGHPLPDERSVTGGSALLEAAVETPRTGTLLALISGGGSALAEAPVRGLGVDDLRQTQDELIRASVPIEEVNTVRRHLSLLKDGGLLRACAGRVVTLLVSDVVDGPASAIASGPTLTDGSTPVDALAVIERHHLAGRLPRRVLEVLAEATEPSRIDADHRWEVIADGAAAASAAADHLRSRSFDAEVVSTSLRGDAADSARRFVEAPRPGVVAVAAGETTVEVRGSGAGGRNQHAALVAALAISGREAVFAALGTDGRDGPTDAAGAVVDGGTITRIGRAGIDPRAALEAFDALPALDAAGDLVRTGPTGTNVGDLWMSWAAG